MRSIKERYGLGKTKDSLLSIQVDYDSRIFGLDLMRAIAIINVVIVHAGWMNVFQGYPWLPIIPGVELFFVLSGFLIGNILLKTYLNEEAYNFRQITMFWKRRWFRTLPNYYLILLLNIVFVYFGVINEDFNQFNWRFFVFAQNLTNGFYGFFWESWSLSIEEWFYLSFPVVLLALNSVFRKVGISRKYVFLTNVALFLFFSILMRAFFGTKLQIENSFAYDTEIHKVVVYHFDGIAFGLLAACIKYWFPLFWYKTRNISFIIGLVISFFFMRWIDWPPNSMNTIMYKTLLQSVGCFFLLPRFDTIKSAPRHLRKIVTHISLISYSMYLINMSMVASVIVSNFEINGKLSALFWYVVYWTIVIIAATFMYKCFEKPIMDLRDKV